MRVEALDPNHWVDILVTATFLLNNVFCENFVGDGILDVP